jgi:hypothetical protein
MNETATLYREYTQPLEVSTYTDYAQSDFARGQRHNPESAWVLGDFASGMRTMAASAVIGDFATGMRTMPASTVIGSFATGMIGAPARVLVDDRFADADGSLLLAA